MLLCCSRSEEPGCLPQHPNLLCPAPGSAEQPLGAETRYSVSRGFYPRGVAQGPSRSSQGKADADRSRDPQTGLQKDSRDGPGMGVPPGPRLPRHPQLPSACSTARTRRGRRWGHSHVHAGGVQGAVPVDRQELHAPDLLLLLRPPEVRLQHPQRHVPEVVHCKRAAASRRAAGQPRCPRP